jgi:hybrid cluster-associated redox disulfide protein
MNGERELNRTGQKRASKRRNRVTQETNKFDGKMTIGEALRLHPRAGEVFAAFHLGGCSHCAINEQETIEEVTAGYGVDSNMLVEALNGLIDNQ